MGKILLEMKGSIMERKKGSIIERGALIALLGATAFFGAASVDAASKDKLTVQGSDTLLEMVTAIAADFMSANPKAIVQVSGGGSGTGIAAIINGSTDIANASRPMKKKERSIIKKRGGELFEIPIALDGISVYVHKSNPLKDLPIEKLAAIYKGQINNWKELGGRDAKIIRYSRENNSGTYAFFKEHVLEKGNYAPDAQNMPGTASVVNAVSRDPNAIGYGGLSYSEGVKNLSINGVAPSPETVADESYPISRELYQYTIGKPTGLAKEFIGYELSAEGQQIARKAGYVPLSERARLEALSFLRQGARIDSAQQEGRE